MENDIDVNKVLIANQIKIKKRQILKFIRNYPLILLLGPLSIGLIVFYLSKYMVYYKDLLSQNILVQHSLDSIYIWFFI